MPNPSPQGVVLIRPISYILAAVFTVLALILLLSAGVGIFFGLVPALLAFCGCLLLAGAYHVNNLFKLVRWLRTPVEAAAPLPRAFGLWDNVFADVNSRARSASHRQERLSAALERFRQASQAMPHGLLFLSETNAIEWVNRQGEQHFGLDQRRDQGAAVTNIVRQPDFVHYLEKGQYGTPLTLTIGRPVSRTLMVHVVPFSEDMRLLMSEDITQGERLESMRRDFVANVSHEMRTPLTVVSGFLEMVTDGLDDMDKEDIRHYLELASEQAGRMQRLIQDLLALSALEAGAPILQEEPVDVPGLLEEIRQEAEVVSAGRHTIELDCSTPARLLGNAKELHSAFANLAINAIRYTPAGGHIRISWRQRGSLVEYAVEDDGIGIAPEHLPRLTERFYRVDRGRSRETGGTGLGLAIVKHVLSRHQGDLLIESQPGKGSRFAACFPARRLAS
ncbi:phosphate regulon sensor histidine kinase PhoR [Zoogloea sp.]|uniref:phosphate regulon sensor histidine kinase PhoR n=1 Tax=Zoogloea sp. TaxID=49181 RepID=UPI00262C7127|nr:phosphate regulon sensor histidine kinase PhoR [Zoogloea sp.]MDD3352466.1 phosphate regulon sensor histidine kinase PhoR [Zoogloea sp.]